MGNLGWAEVAMIAVVALVVLGPDKLPNAARQIGSVIRQFRKISTGFQQELQNALDEPIEAEARQRGKQAVQQSGEEDQPLSQDDSEGPTPGPTAQDDQVASNPTQDSS